MNFIQQIRRFDELSAGNLAPNAIAIYYHLLNVNNRCGWKEWFTESDLWIGRFVGIKRHETIVAAINLLKQKGFIDFERGTKRNQPTKYKIIVLFNSTEHSTKDSTKHSTKHSTEYSTEHSTEHSDNPKHKQETKTKTKTRNINTNTRVKFVPPSLDEVNAYVMEKNLSVSAKKFFDYYTAGDWKDIKGNSVKNWKQKLLTWDSKNKQNTPRLSTEQSTGNPQVEMCQRVIDRLNNQERGETA